MRALRAPGAPQIHDVRELGLHGMADEVLMIELGKLGYAGFVTRDSRILNAAIRRDAWLHSGLTLFVLDGKWGSLLLFEQARRLIWCWPELIKRQTEGPQGAAWKVAPDPSPSSIVRIFADHQTSIDVVTEP
jgi:hypothetical protein